MNQDSPYQFHMTAADAEVDERRGFIKQVYMHFAFAILGFGILEALLLKIPGIEATVFNALGTSRFSWLIVLCLFMAVGYVADRMAHSNMSRGMQYAGLGLYVLAQALIFLPLVIMAKMVAGGSVDLIFQAFFITLAIFLALTFVVLTTKKDFSFLGGFLKIAFIAALAVIAGSILFGMALPTMLFSGVMIVLVGLAVLYQTSNILHSYPVGYHVGAALGLFASFATMLWYVLQFLMSMASSD